MTTQLKKTEVGVLLWVFDVLPVTFAAANFVLLHALLARIIFNLNPFLRLDGYWL